MAGEAMKFKITDYLEKLENTIKRDKENLKHAPPGSPARAELDGQSKLVAMLKIDLCNSPVKARTEKRQWNIPQNIPEAGYQRICGMLDDVQAICVQLCQKNQLSEE